MIEYWDLILAVIGAVVGFLLCKYGYSQYNKTVEIIMKSLEDGKITKQEAKEILDELIKAIDNK